MKNFMKNFGFACLMGGAMLVLNACSKDVSVDPDYAHKKKVAEYDAAFEHAFGKIASNHDWGFGQFTVSPSTRGAVVSTQDPVWAIPTDITDLKEGNFGNKVQAAFQSGVGLRDDVVFDFDNYWLLHVDQPKHGNDSRLQAYEDGIGWIDVTNFEKGKNTGFYTVSGNNALHGGTLMVDMDNAKDANGKMFRWGKEGYWNYDYKFLTYDGHLYLGLPHESNKGEISYWVILIAEANKIESEPVKARVFCEDMGSIGDFDFNDVVFDAKFNEDKSITIEILAAGGTLPIKVAGHDVTLGQMTNTGVNKAGTQVITLPAVNGNYAYESIKDIPVVVNPGGDALPYELVAQPNKAPQKICTYVGVRWADEYVNIKNAYLNFNSWVNTATPSDWYQNMVYELTDLDLSNNK